MPPISILHLEDSPLDAELTNARLAGAGLEAQITRVDTRAGFVAALDRGSYDLILADLILPDFDGLSALAHAQAQCPDVPFIFVSGALGEERAIESLLQGATDYVLKQRLERLVPAVQRALRETAVRAEHRRTAEQVRESEERMRLALAVGRMGTWDLDLVTGQIQWSEQAGAMLGDGPRLPGTFEEFLARVQPEDRQRVRETIETGVARGADHTTEFRFERADGSVAWINLSGRVVPDGAGRPSRIVGIGSDVTERRRAEEHLRQVQRMEALGRLAGGMAHEANNQMAVVMGFADFVLRRPDLPGEVRADLDQIRRAAERTAAVTHQLLTFSRRQLVHPEVLDVNAVIEGFVPVLRRTIGVQSRLECRLDTPHWVRIGRGQLEQVLLNLALNASDAMPRGGTLTIETAELDLPPPTRAARTGFTVREGRYVLIAVSDTGSGMAPETVERIFEPFFTTKDVGKGSGLGLAAVYGIVKQADGYVWARSQPGHGTTFQVYLPVAREPEPGLARRQSGAVGGTEVVLVVEDEPDMRAIAARALGEEGYEVLEAANGREALELIERRHGCVHVVVSDIAMPVMDGDSLRDVLARRRAGIPVLLMSGYTHDDLVRRGLIQPDQAFLQKPFAPSDLARRVRETIDRAARPCD